jgi:hypothetical protein
VAVELERRWNDALQTVRRIENGLAAIVAAKPPPPDEPERQQLMRLGADLERAWSHSAATAASRKRVLRTALNEIVVRKGGTSRMRSHSPKARRYNISWVSRRQRRGTSCHDRHGWGAPMAVTPGCLDVTRKQTVAKPKCSDSCSDVCCGPPPAVRLPGLNAREGLARAIGPSRDERPRRVDFCQSGSGPERAEIGIRLKAGSGRKLPVRSGALVRPMLPLR